MRKTFYHFLSASCLIAGLLPFATTTTQAQTSASTLQQDVNALQNVGNTGVLAQVNDHGRVTTAVAGVAQLGTNQPVPFDAHYRTGSVTKTFVAVTLLQLVGEGKLSLDDTVDRWLPGVITGNGNDGTKISVRQLLQHTSGLFDYTADTGFFSTLDTPDAFFANRLHHYSPQDLINIALSHPPNFSPGATWSYSSTNYIVAGEIIKAVTGNTWDVELNNRIINPLNLTGTMWPGDDPTIPANFAHAYHIYTTNPSDRVYTDTTEHNMTWAGSTGGLITTTQDESKFFSALLSGQLLRPAELAELKTVVPIAKGIGYGLGIVSQQLSCSKTPIWWHNGGVVGYTTWSGTTPDGSLSLTLSLSTTTFTDDTYNETSNNLSDALIRHVFCGPQSTATDQIQGQRKLLFGSNPVLD